MAQAVIGSIGFLMLFIGDFNDWKLSSPALKLCFPLGSLVVAAATCTGFFSGDGIRHILLSIPAAIFLFLLVYTLFFALPADEAYVSQQKGRPVCNKGVYGLCRHPGVLWLLGLYACLYLMDVVNLCSFIVFNALNFMLVVFEDTCVFPERIADYEEYKRSVRFILPNIFNPLVYSGLFTGHPVKGRSEAQ